MRQFKLASAEHRVTSKTTTMANVLSPNDSLLQTKRTFRVLEGRCCGNAYLETACQHGCSYRPFTQFCCFVYDGFCCAPQLSVPTTIPASYGYLGLYCCYYEPKDGFKCKFACCPTPGSFFDLGESAAQQRFGAKAKMTMLCSTCYGCCGENCYCTQPNKCCFSPGSVSLFCCAGDCAFPCDQDAAPYVCGCPFPFCLTISPQCTCLPELRNLYPDYWASPMDVAAECTSYSAPPAKFGAGSDPNRQCC